MTEANFAASRGAAARAWEAADRFTSTALTEMRMPGGFSIWSLGSVACIVESLNEDAPAQYAEIIRQRVMANLTGRCGECDAIASVIAQGQSVVQHETRCAIGNPPPGLATYLDSAGTAFLRAVSTGIPTKGNTK